MTAPTISPFPYPGGKARIAARVWRELGDVYSYLEPFVGSAACLLARPPSENRHRTVIGDANGYVANAWRSIAWDPDMTARWAWWPTSHVDLTARHRWLVRWGRAGGLERLKDDPWYFDPQVAGWWIWGISNWISMSDFCAAAFVPERAVSDTRPHVTHHNRGQNVQTTRVGTPHGVGAHDKRPVVVTTAGGRGVAVNRTEGRDTPPDGIPHVQYDHSGQGVQASRIQTPEACPSCAGTGIRPAVAFPSDSIPHASGPQGVQNARLGWPLDGIPYAGPPRGTMPGRATNPSDKIPTVGGGGVCNARVTDGIPKVHTIAGGEKVTNQRTPTPELGQAINPERWIPWFRKLAEHMVLPYILARSWETTLGSRSLLGDFDKRSIGVFLDPPYLTRSRVGNLYALDDGDNVFPAVWAWAKEYGERENFRIAICGLDGDFDDIPPGWREYRWRNSGGVNAAKNAQKAEEIVMFSPHCLGNRNPSRQTPLLGL